MGKLGRPAKYLSLIVALKDDKLYLAASIADTAGPEQRQAVKQAMKAMKARQQKKRPADGHIFGHKAYFGKTWKKFYGV